MVKSNLVFWGGMIALVLMLPVWLTFPADIVVPKSPAAQTLTQTPVSAPTATRPPEPTPTPVPPNPTQTPGRAGTTTETGREGSGGTTILILLGVLVGGFVLAVLIPFIRVRTRR
jgi:hypothetical protein